MPPRVRLVLLSALMLFVELALIRWTGSNVVYLSYFSNFVLLGSFLGIGIGFLRARAHTDLFAWAPVVLAFFIAFVRVFQVQLYCAGSQLIFFGCEPTGLPIWVMLPVIFMAVAFTMTAIAQGVARTFVTFPPLEAYRLDILGSLCGVAGFTALSFLGAPPVVWGALCAFSLLALLEKPKLVQLTSLTAIVIMLGFESLAPGDSWSPYYKISVFRATPKILAVDVNGIPHQEIESTATRRRERLYFETYGWLAGKNPLRDVLIVGAGNGGDVAIALALGAKHVDAVEIDPGILALGRTLNPEHPYDDPRVTIYNDDGRAFLERTRKRYDLILFALPDSLTLVSGASSLRLESYLFTAESMAAAHAHLAERGTFAMYNFYREPWLVDRLAGTLTAEYGRTPCFDVDRGHLALFGLLAVTSGPTALACDRLWQPTVSPAPGPVHDDYPFLYLRTRSIPEFYLLTIAVIALASLVLVRAAAGPFGPMRAYLDLYFMGAAFLLLETKNVVQFALLFGTTWLVNALVFFGILLSVYAAVEVARRVRVGPPVVLYGALFAALALAWAVPPELLLRLDAPLRLGVAVALAFAPVFLANLIFAERFGQAAASTTAFGANLLGAMTGGLLEYLSLVLGYRSLLPIVALLYAAAFVARRAGAQRPESSPEAQFRMEENFAT